MKFFCAQINLIDFSIILVKVTIIIISGGYNLTCEDE